MAQVRCLVCKEMFEKYEAVPVKIRDRGNRNGYLCGCHSKYINDWDSLYSYSKKNNQRLGKPKAHGDTFGIELELTCHPDTVARGELGNLNFIPTSDCTVSEEWKSPIFYGLNSLSKIMDTLDWLIESGHMDKPNVEAGTHLHIGNENLFNNDFLADHYHTLFDNLSREVENNPDDATRIFGRSFDGNRWALPTYECWSNDHKSWINLEHDYTVEFRLCKYIDGKQYYKAVCLCRELFNKMKKFMEFCEQVQDYGEREKYARKVSRMMVKVWEKAVNA